MEKALSAKKEACKSFNCLGRTLTDALQCEPVNLDESTFDFGIYSFLSIEKYIPIHTNSIVFTDFRIIPHSLRLTLGRKRKMKYYEFDKHFRFATLQCLHTTTTTLLYICKSQCDHL